MKPLETAVTELPVQKSGGGSIIMQHWNTKTVIPRGLPSLNIPIIIDHKKMLLKALPQFEGRVVKYLAN